MSGIKHMSLLINRIFFVFFLLTSFDSISQEINWPSTIPTGSGAQQPINKVFQRDASGKATVKFVVSAGSAVTTVKVRFKQYAITGSDGSTYSLGGSYIDPRPGSASLAGDGALNFGSSPFQGLGSNTVVTYQLDIKGGMYRMEAIINGTQKEVDFGVGEVLVIAGQSNAAGYVHDGFDKSLGYGNVKFVHFNNTKTDFEDGDPKNNDKYFPWFWCRLGTKLAQNLQVPVAFYQTAWSNSSVADWRKSAYEGQSVQFSQTGQPYKNFKSVITDVRGKVGLRGVLWQQGERDNTQNAGGVMQQTGILGYDQNLADLIVKSRSDMGWTGFAWVIAQASMNSGISDPGGIVAAQQRVIGHTDAGGTVLKDYGDPRKSARNGADTVSSRFKGPYTDEILGSARRSGGGEPTHFSTSALSGTNCGQCQAADKWFTALTQLSSYNNRNFFGNSAPALNTQVTEGPTGLSECNCGFSLLSASQVSGQMSGQFTFHSCNAFKVRWTLLDGTTEKASAELEPGGPTETFSIPASVNSGNYTLRVVPVSCTGNSSSVYEKPFSYTKPGTTSWYVNVTPYPLSVPASGGTYYISVNSNTNWWMTGTPAAWSSFSNTSGSGIGTITVTVQPNTTTSSRSVTMMINADNVAAQPYTVSQAAASSGSGTCYYFELANYHYTSGVTKQAMEVNGQGVVKIQDFNTSSSSQIWRVESVGAYKKISRASDANSVLGVSGGQSNIGDQVVLQPYSGADYQLWEEEASSSVTTNCAGCVIYKHKANGNVAFGSPLGNWGDGDASASVNDIRLVSKSDAYIYGNFKWFRTQVACPGGGRVSAEEITPPESRLAVSSNPNAGEFRVRFFLAPGRKGDLGVTDLTGRVVYQRAVTGEGEQTVDVKLAPSVSGTVIVSLKTEKGVLSERVLVTR